MPAKNARRHGEGSVVVVETRTRATLDTSCTCVDASIGVLFKLPPMQTSLGSIEWADHSNANISSTKERRTRFHPLRCIANGNVHILPSSFGCILDWKGKPFPLVPKHLQHIHVVKLCFLLSKEEATTE